MELFCPKLNNLSWETICQNIVETIGIVLNADIAIICAHESLDKTPQCFYYQASREYLPSISSEILQKTVSLTDNLVVFNDIDACAALPEGSRPCPQTKRDPYPKVYPYAKRYPLGLGLGLGQGKTQTLDSLSAACQQIKVKSSLSIPLTDQANLKATLTLHRCQPASNWQPEEIKLAGKMATQAGLAIAQIEAYENMRSWAQREATLNRITNAIRSSLEPQVMFNTIVSELGSALEVDGCSLSLWTKSDRFMRCVAFYNPQEPTSLSHENLNQQNSTISVVQIADNPVLQKLLQERKPLVFQDLAAKKELARHDLPWRSKSKALLIVPLILNGEIMGSLTLRQSALSRQWEQSEIQLAQAVATQAGLAIAQIEAYENMRSLAQREATLNRITNAIRGSLEPQVMFNSIVSELGSALRVDGCSLSLWTKSDRFMRCVAFYNPQEPTSLSHENLNQQNSTISVVQIADNPVLQKLLQERKPLVFQDLAAKKELARHDLPWRSKSKALLIVPLLLNGEIMGSLTLRQSALSRQWEQSEIQLAQAVANQAAIAVKQARLYDTTRKQAEQLQISQQKVEKLNHYLTESILKRFLPEAIANKAAAGKLTLDLNPELQWVTILFCDLVGFTNLSTKLEVNLLSELLNEYLEAMAQAVFEQGGTIDKFLGDAVMALFGAPEALSPQEQSQRAIATAQAMYRYLQPINQKWQAQGIGVAEHLPSLQLRCGIHQGDAVVGMFGGQQRKDYTAIGQVVNIAARLEKNAAPDSILVSETVLHNLVLPEYQKIPPQSLKLKGIEQDFIAYSLNIKH